MCQLVFKSPRFEQRGNLDQWGIEIDSNSSPWDLDTSTGN